MTDINTELANLAQRTEHRVKPLGGGGVRLYCDELNDDLRMVPHSVQFDTAEEAVAYLRRLAEFREHSAAAAHRSTNGKTTFTIRPPWVVASKHDGSPKDIQVTYNGNELSKTDLARALLTTAEQLFMEAIDPNDGPISRLPFRADLEPVPF